MASADGDTSGTGPQAAERGLAVALRAYRLKDEPRRGWVLRGVEGPESVAAHAWGTALLCLLFGGPAGVDVSRALAIATVHDLAEAEVGDIAARADPRDREVSAARKADLEAGALDRILGGERPELRALWREYEQAATPEARFVRDMNLLDMALQALLYEEQARYDPSRPLASRGGYRHLDEFFVSAQERVEGALARRLLSATRRLYEGVRGGGGS